MVDVSHGNSGKQHERQIASRPGSPSASPPASGASSALMIESHLEAGRQDLVPGVPLQHGVSITDACIGFAQTVPVLRSLASAVAARRRRR